MTSRPTPEVYANLSRWSLSLLIVAALLAGPVGCGNQDDNTSPEVCDNEVDDNDNGLVDCEDRDCFAASNCQVRQEHCYNLVDDDGDGDVDCQDSDCESTVVCLARSENCINSVDDDSDGDQDCNDRACENTATCLDGAENCTNGLDDDGDGAVDCDDSDCEQTAVCTARGEICDNGADDDKDGAVDCDDADCARTAICLPEGGEVCNNGLDDDSDGLVDCRDLDCAYTSTCLAHGENCDNGIDDDGNGVADCLDPFCDGAPACQTPSEDCQNGIDDDEDGDTDCDDADCTNTSACLADLEDCVNGSDDDGDGDVDCDDADCEFTYVCIDNGEDCVNGSDDDGDGDVDCADADCANTALCATPVENCQDGVDNDGDSLVDCADADCSATSFCDATEICDSGIDEDGDGDTDCSDSDCVADVACASYTLVPLPTTSGGSFSGLVNGRIGPAAVEVRNQNSVLLSGVELSVTGSSGTAVLQDQIVTNEMGVAGLEVRLGASVGTYTFTVEAPDGTTMDVTADATLPPVDTIMPVANLSSETGAPTSGDPALTQPLGVGEMDVDSQSGDVYVADPANHQVHKIAPDGTITVVAGVGTAGFSGDGGPALQAELDTPIGLAIDEFERFLYIGDTGNGVLRLVDLKIGDISTLTDASTAGDAAPYSTAVAASGATVGPLYTLDNGNAGVVFGSGPDTAGVLKFTDASGSWEVSNLVTTQACSAAAPSSMVLNACGATGCPLYHRFGNVRVWGDYCGDAVGSATPRPGIATPSGTSLFPMFTSDETVTSLPAPAYAFAFPAEVTDMMADQAGNIFLAAGTRVLRIDVGYSRVDEFAGSTITGNRNDFLARRDGRFVGPLELTMGTDGGLLVADRGNANISRVTGANATQASPVILDRPGYYGSEVLMVGQEVFQPLSVTVLDGNGDPLPGVIVKFSPFQGGGAVRSPEATTNQFGVASMDYFATIYPASAIVEARVDTLGGASLASVEYDYEVRGLLSKQITTAANAFQRSGVPSSFEQSIGAPLGSPFDMVADGAGNAFISDKASHQIYKIDSSGNISAFAGTGTQGAAVVGDSASSPLDTPGAMAFDPNVTAIYVAEEGTGRILMLDYQTGLLSSPPTTSVVAGGGAAIVGSTEVDATTVDLGRPYSISYDPPSGNLYLFASNVDGLAQITAPESTPMISTKVATDSGCTGSSLLAGCTGDKCRVGAANDWYFVYGDYCDTQTGTTYEALIAYDNQGFNSPIVLGVEPGTGTSTGSPIDVSTFEFGVPLDDIVVHNATEVFFSQPGIHTVRRYDLSNGKVVADVNDSFTAGYTGDTGAAASAQVDTPSGLGMDGQGSYLWIVDSGNGVIRRVTDPVSLNIVIGN